MPWLIPLGFSREGRFHYAIWANERQIYQAAVDLERGELTSLPEPAAHAAARTSVSPDWSPDGRHLAYILPTIPGGGPPVLAVRALDTGELRELTPRLRNFTQVRWSPDPRIVLLRGQDLEGREGVFRLNLETGELALFFLGEETPRQQTLLSPDGRSVYFVRQQGETAVYQLVRRELDTGIEIEIQRGPNGTLALSPDGRQIAYAAFAPAGEPRPLLLFPAAGGAPRVLHRVPPATTIFTVDWSPDGRHILFVASTVAGHNELWQLRVATGEKRRLLAMAGLTGVQVHPDGARIAFAAGTGRLEVWSMARAPAPSRP
ncbi:MAG TPA: hypothetical protein VMN37_04935 [Gemmatimonadales bacterium]|nr:hypothetical protein [Gemmatimonadales bacterium]